MSTGRKTFLRLIASMTVLWIVSTEGSVIYVAGGGSLTRIDTSSGDITQPVHIGMQNRGVVVSKTGQLFVSLRYGGDSTKNVVEFDKEGNFIRQVTPTLPKFGCGLVELDSNGNIVLAEDVSGGAGRVSVYDPATGNLLKSFSPYGNHAIVGVTTAGNHAYAASLFQGHIYKYDLRGSSEINSRSVFIEGAITHGRYKALGLTVGHNGNLFVAPWEAGYIKEFNINTGEFVRDFILTDGRTWGFKYDSSSNRYYRANGGAVIEYDADGNRLNSYVAPGAYGIGLDIQVDSDSDGILDDSDNCLDDPNPNQEDLDGDLIGDVCDSDDDGDSVADDVDNCPAVVNPDQVDVDQDGIGDACDDLVDNDADGVANNLDNCPSYPNADQADNDTDGAGDACDPDDDNDGVGDVADNCPLTANSDQADNDADNIGDICDLDDDNDGVADDVDNCPVTANASQEDTDSDGEGDICDDDDDGDLVPDDIDNCPLTSNPNQENTDGFGAGDACNDANDQDGDDWEDNYDNCPTVANGNQTDFDTDGLGDACDEDIDNDGVTNGSDICPTTPLALLVNGSGCSLEQLCPCEGPRQSAESWRNHGKYVSCVAQSIISFAKDGFIERKAVGGITSEAAKSDCGLR
jgi:hypothetical protein